MAGVNTEKPTSVAEKKKNLPIKEAKAKVESAPVKKAEAKEEIKKTDDKKEVKVKPKVKKDTAKVSGINLPISFKIAAFICRFISNKKIDIAIKDLEAVTKMKKAVPMGKEVPHRKGAIAAGRFPQKAAGEILSLVKSLKANANQNDMDDPVIVIAMANKAQLPFGKGGRVKRKRSHVTLIAKEKSLIKKGKKN